MDVKKPESRVPIHADKDQKPLEADRKMSSEFWDAHQPVDDYPGKALPSDVFVAVGDKVMCGDVRVAIARSKTMAKRIAAALTEYKPNQRAK